MLRDSSSDSSTTLTPDKRHNVALSVNRAYSTKENLDQSSTLYTSLSDSESSRILFRDQSSLVHVGTEASLWNLAKDIKGDQVLNLPTQQSTTIKVVKNANSHFSSMPLVALIVVLLLPINDFLRGVLACLFFVMTLENILIFLGIFADRFFLSFKTQKAPFTLPDYFEMPSIEIPPVKEQSTYKQYEGWMNEIDVYDLETYHISMTRPVHLKLEGTMLQVSNTNDYVKKRVLYGDEPIDMNHITFTTKRVYNLFGCRVELLPKGLPRRRHFGRKFPIQLVIKASSIIKIEKFAVQQKKKLDKVKVIPSEKRQKNIDLMRNPLTKTASDERHDEHLETDRRDKHLERLNHKLNVRTNESDSKVTSKEKYVEFREEPSTVSYQDQSSSAESFESEGIFEQLDGHEEILDYKEIGTQSSSTDFIDSSHPNEKYNNEIVENNSIGKLEKNFDLDKQASSTENIGEIEAIDLMAASNNKKEEISNTADVVSINTNLIALHELNPEEDAIANSDEIHLLLFARVAREKEDWFRRFVAASKGDIKDRDINLANTRDIGEEDVKAASAAADTLANPHHIQLKRQQKHGFHKIAEPAQYVQHSKKSMDRLYDESIEGLIMYASAARCDPQYLNFMATIQNACTQERIPVFKEQMPKERPDKKRKRSIRRENILWKGIDQSLFLGPSGSVVWANALIGRIIYGAVQNDYVLQKIKWFLQKKINQVKLPSFIESINVDKMDVGKTPPLIHRLSQPVINERGVWVDADITYEGRFHLTIITKIDMKRIRTATDPKHVLIEVNPDVIRRPSRSFLSSRSDIDAIKDPEEEHELEFDAISQSSAVYESDFDIYESSSTSSFLDEREKEPDTQLQNDQLKEDERENTGKDTTAVVTTQPEKADDKPISPARKRLRGFVDRIAALNLIQIATDNPYIQRAMEKMHTTVILDLQIRGMVGRIALNIPPPPSDRIWMGFRAPPRVWLSAHPSVGEKSVDWAFVTNVIENKICQAINQFFVFPNMEDMVIPIIGEPASETYKEFEIPHL